MKINGDSEIRFTLKWPPSVNHYWGQRVIGNRIMRFMGAKGKAFRDSVQSIVEPHIGHCNKYFGKKSRLSATIYIYPPDKRRRDIDNLAKATLDALEHAGVYDDDTQIDSLHLVRNPDNIIEGGKIEVILAQLDGPITFYED